MTADFTVKTTITHNDEDYEVEGVYIPGDPGQLSGPPERCYPPGDPEIEVISIEYEGRKIGDGLFGMLYEVACDAIEQAYWDEQ